MSIRKRNVIVALIAAAVGVLLGLNVTRYHGYVVGYSIVGLFFVSMLIALASTILLGPESSRSFGVSGIVAGVSFFASFYATIVAANVAGAWDRPMVRIGPDVQASLVALFHEDATDAAIYDFTANVVATPHPGGGSQHLPGMQGLLKVRVGQHDGYAIQLSPDVTTAERRHIHDRIKTSNIVWKVFENVAPEDIVLPEGG